jgi:tetratricopeptide (TPR) repeat protein
VQRSQIMLDRGEVEQPLVTLEAIIADRRDTLEGDPHLACRRAEALVELGRFAEARSVLDRLAANDFAALSTDMRYGVNLAACAIACAALGDARLAVRLYGRLRLAAGRNLLFGPALVSAGPASRYLGLVAATMGRRDLARRHFEEALAATRRMGWLPLAARTQYDWADALLRGRRRCDRGAAERLLDEAIDSAARLGLPRVESRARALRARCQRNMIAARSGR